MSNACSWCKGEFQYGEKTAEDGDGGLLHQTTMDCAEDLRERLSAVMSRYRVASNLIKGLAEELTKRRVMEPQHSRIEHLCMECEVISEARRFLDNDPVSRTA